MKSFRPFLISPPAFWWAGFALLVAMLGSSCSTVTVRTQKGLLARESLASAKILEELGQRGGAEGAVVSETIRQSLRAARRGEWSGNSDRALAGYLCAAVKARGMLSHGSVPPGSQAETEWIEIHNDALSKFAELWATDPRRVLGGPHRFCFGTEEFEIRESPQSDYRSGYFDRAIATEAIRGRGVVDTHRDGFGASLVGIREKTASRAEEMKHFSDRGLHLPVTLKIEKLESVSQDELHRQIVTIRLHDPIQEGTVSVGSRTYPLAADFSAPLELILKGRSEVIEGLSGFFDAKHRIKKSGIGLLEPYDPNRIPVILTH